MSIYTIIPEDALWDGLEGLENLAEIELNGILLQVRMEPGYNKGTIVRLLRCGLEDYLNPSFSPGREIHFLPFLPQG